MPLNSPMVYIKPTNENTLSNRVILMRVLFARQLSWHRASVWTSILMDSRISQRRLSSVGFSSCPGIRLLGTGPCRGLRTGMALLWTAPNSGSDSKESTNWHRLLVINCAWKCTTRKLAGLRLNTRVFRSATSGLNIPWISVGRCSSFHQIGRAHVW